MARLNGVEINYFVAGRGPVLVVHPGGPGLEWKYIRMPRLEPVATVVYIDPRGSGRSSRLPGLKDYRIDRMVEDLDGLRRHLKLDRMALMGHSHGGMVAQQYAHRHQARLTKLILACTAPCAGAEWAAGVKRNIESRSGEAWYGDAKAALAEQAAMRTERALRAGLKRSLPLYFHRWEPFRQKMFRILDGLRVSPEPLRAFSDLDAPSFDMRDRLKQIRLPTLIVAGRHDPVSSPEWAAEMRRLIPRSRLSIFERSGHFPFIEEEEAFALTVGAFLIAD